MADPEQVERLKSGVREWNERRKDAPEAVVDLQAAELAGLDLRLANLTGAQLFGANLAGADLGEANLSGADLRKANLRSTHLRRANLAGIVATEADFTEANLRRAALRNADLYRANLRLANCIGIDASGANLQEVDLDEVNLAHANLSQSKFHGARLQETIFGFTNLRDAQGLAECHHLGPSILDVRTLVRSGQLPLPFIRGCGLPDALIAYLPALLTSAIQFYSCFISYSTADQEFAERLHSDLQAKGIRCWFALHDIQGGRKIHEQIDEAIRLHDKLLLILSPSSMKSSWVETEISKARKREVRENARVLFPVRLAPFEKFRDWECFDADTGRDSAREIREFSSQTLATGRTTIRIERPLTGWLRTCKHRRRKPINPGSLLWAHASPDQAM